jgi:Methyltransferase domain/Domain of unknown function (DUF4214)
MDQIEARGFIVMLYQLLLKRSPAEHELQGWTAAALKSSSIQIMELFAKSPEFRKRQGVPTFFPAGHFHSPIVNPDEVADYVARNAKLEYDKIAGIGLDLPKMERFWTAHQELFRDAQFPETKSQSGRFYYSDSPFPYGDAITLYAILGSQRPRKLVEIGSGFSTACMLDSADRLGLSALEITCIEPYPSRLKALLRPNDYERLTIIESPVQRVPLEALVSLSRNDILFIDSTHVLKTGSDVHYELFDILPALPSGVLIHVHDCPYPFEYPSAWIFRDNYSWNEAYAIRAFLMYNDRFEVFFWSSLFWRTYMDEIRKINSKFLVNPGTSIWLLVK